LKCDLKMAGSAKQKIAGERVERTFTSHINENG
jgi:hypothetical protein